MPLPKQFRSKTLNPPNLRQLVHWGEVCRYMDAQPHRAIAAPFPDDPPISYPLLRNMSRFKLVRHRNSDCTWQLNIRWQTILKNLARGIVEERAPKSLQVGPHVAFVVDHGVDTMYVNVLAEDVPARFLDVAYALKEKAQGEYNSVITPWLFGGKPLSLWPNGKGVSETGGVSWGLIFRNDLVEIRVRKKPVSGIVAMVRFSAECLWLYQPKPSLDLMVRCIKTMWADPEAYAEIRYQLSQIHLCVDVAHYPLTLEHLPRIVTHQIKRAVHVPSQADLELDDSWLTAGTTVSDDDAMLYDGTPPMGWEDEEDDADPYPDVDFYEEELLDDEPDVTDEDDDEADNDDEESADDAEEEAPNEHAWDAAGGKFHLRGQKVEGINFSPAGAMSAAWYDKILEERKAKLKKPWMREIHKLGGWQDEMVLTRIELRWKRSILNELESAFGTGKGAKWFDDPWIACDHFGDLWGWGVGFPPERDDLPDMSYRGWMRLAVPDADNQNRTRWQTDPLWEVVQRTPFSEGMPKPLRRIRQVKPDLDQLDAQIRGMFITRAMMRGTYLKAPASLSRELEAFDDRIADYDQEKGLDFAEDVRERARQNGKQVPYREPLVLPKKPTTKRKPTG